MRTYRGSYLLSPVCSEYHQRNRILLPGSEWDRVVPRRQATTIRKHIPHCEFERAPNEYVWQTD